MWLRTTITWMAQTDQNIKNSPNIVRNTYRMKSCGLPAGVAIKLSTFNYKANIIIIII